jgi:RimJ/RimL family protein N-acetyltransferase
LDSEKVTIGYTFIVRDFWGGGTNWEIKELMLRHALSSVKTAVFRVGEKNLRSQNALEKIGASFHSRDGSSLVYRIRAPDFMKFEADLDWASFK